MIMLQTVLTPVVMATLMESMFWCGSLTFISAFSYTCINYIACEIEMPFGDDENDLPVSKLQESFNTALIMLTHKECTRCPEFKFQDSHRACDTTKCPFYLCTDTQHKIFANDHNRIQRKIDDLQDAAERMSKGTDGLVARLSRKSRAPARASQNEDGKSIDNIRNQMLQATILASKGKGIRAKVSMQMINELEQTAPTKSDESQASLGDSANPSKQVEGTPDSHAQVAIANDVRRDSYSYFDKLRVAGPDDQPRDDLPESSDYY